MPTDTEWEARVLALLKTVGNPGVCGGCEGPIYWLRTIRNNRPIPYDPNGQPHWATCPKADQFRKRPR